MFSTDSLACFDRSGGPKKNVRIQMGHSCCWGLEDDRELRAGAKRDPMMEWLVVPPDLRQQPSKEDCSFEEEEQLNFSSQGSLMRHAIHPIMKNQARGEPNFFADHGPVIYPKMVSFRQVDLNQLKVVF